MSAITQVMASERPYVTPLMVDLDATRQKLARATQNAHPDQKQISSLALTQAQLLTKLVAENADLQAKISGLLNSEQRMKIERLRQGNEVSSLRGESSKYRFGSQFGLAVCRSQFLCLWPAWHRRQELVRLVVQLHVYSN